MKHQDPRYAEFYWQRGHGAFSIGQSQAPVVSRYIRNQKEHHKAQSYKDEFRALCTKYEVEIDERYCWDWLFAGRYAVSCCSLQRAPVLGVDAWGSVRFAHFTLGFIGWSPLATSIATSPLVK